MKKIALFASGNGSNVENIVRHFNATKTANVVLILSNNRQAYVLQRANNLGIPSIVFGREEFNDPNAVLKILNEHDLDLIVLAGFLWLVPEFIVKAFPGKILNIHPALLPKYGGKGMYGDKVHQAVIVNGEKESGISIHKVSPIYDDGQIVFQAKCRLEKNESPESLAEKVHALEYEHFPQVIERYL
jgi:phosphoribosylglycinamide formyltransferase 1